MHDDPVTARAFWVRSPGSAGIQPEALAPLTPGEVQVRTLFSGISRGTESLVYSGSVPQSQYEAMRAPFQSGDFPGPVKYGYISVGVIEEGPAERIGERVFCLYPHQDRYRVPGSAALPLPADLPPGRAVLAANMETAINALWDAAPMVGDRILVIGAGVLGLLVAWLCRQIPGAEVTLIDVNPARGDIARAWGLPFAPHADPASEADLVIHASGNPAGLEQALNSAGPEATIVELSWYGDRRVTLPLGEAFHSRRLLLKSSQVGRVPPHRSARWDFRRRLALALDLLRDERLDRLITGESPFDQLPEVLAKLATEPGDTLCHRIRYP
jgi:NADPH:quinone reductase-like Zn-dependent oxidoreductase